MRPALPLLSPDQPTRRRWVRRLLVPHVFAVVFFLAAARTEAIYQTNRSALDFNLAMAGYIALLSALIATAAAFRFHPWPHRLTD